jgi:hypothetical protein
MRTHHRQDDSFSVLADEHVKLNSILSTVSALQRLRHQLLVSACVEWDGDVFLLTYRGGFLPSFARPNKIGFILFLPHDGNYDRFRSVASLENTEIFAN